MIIDYMVVRSYDNLPTFESEVRKMIVEGWQPSGGVSVTEQRNVGAGMVICFLQAMVKITK